MIRHALIAIVALASIFDSAGSVLAQPPAAKKRALLVGVSTYQKQGLADKPLPFAATDMEILAVELKKAGWDVKLLRSKGADNSATLKEIWTALDETLNGVNADDLILVALSGHGQQFLAKLAGKSEPIEEAFFCPSDGTPGDAETLLGMTELLDRLGKKGGKNLVLIDACRDDPRRGGKGVEGNTARNVPPNTAILFSCAARQQSFETNQMYDKNSTKGHGVFFHRVWQGLKSDARNARGEVTWDRLVEYVKENVNEDAVKWFPERVIASASGEKIVQTPHMVGSLVGKSPVLVNVDMSGSAGPRMTDAEKQYHRGLKLFLGQRGRADIAEAYRCFLDSAEQGFAPSAFRVALMQTCGFEVAKIDNPSALRWLRQAANAGYAPAEAVLGQWILLGRSGLKPDNEKGHEWIAKANVQLQAKESNDSDFLNCYGEILWTGLGGVEKNPALAVRLFEQAANLGDAFAQYNLGRAYETGIGVSKNYELATKWTRKAADLGHAFAQVSLGVRYQNGWGFEKNDVEAFQWFMKGAAQGYGSAQFFVGSAYERGRGVNADEKKAIEWYRKASDQGFVSARVSLDRLTKSGPHSPMIDTRVFEAYSGDKKGRVTGQGDLLSHFSDNTVTWSVKHKGVITCLAYSDNGRRVATGCSDGIVRVFDSLTGKNLQEIEFSATSLTFGNGYLEGKDKAGAKESWKLR